MSEANRPGRLYGIGVGPGDPELVTLKASRVLSRVPVVFVPKKDRESASRARSIIAGFVSGRQKVVELVFPMLRDRDCLAGFWQQAADSIWQHLDRGEDCALVNLGDPLVYGTFIHVLEMMRRGHPGLEVEVIPGVSSINAAAARSLVPLAVDDERVAIVSGMSEDAFIRETLLSFDTVVFMKVHSALDRLLGILEELGLAERGVCLERCTTGDEKIVTDIRTLKGRKPDYFSIVIVRR